MVKVVSPIQACASTKEEKQKEHKKEFQENFFNLYEQEIANIPLAYFSHMAVIAYKGGWEV
jgi:hypothetical protein